MPPWIHPMSMERWKYVRHDAARILRIAWPVIIAQVSVVGMHFTDTVMAGRLGPDALAAVSLGMTSALPVYLVVLGVLSAVSPSIAQLIGAQREAEVGGVFRQGLWLGFGLALVTVPLMRHVWVLMSWLEVDASVIPVAGAYLDAVSWGLPGVCLLFTLRFFSEGVAAPRMYMWVMLFGAGINIFANYAFMYGNFGMPALGAVGCGVATALVQTLISVVLLVYVVVYRRFRIYHLLSRLEGPHPRALIELMRIGLPAAGAFLLEGGMFSLVGLLMGTLGATAVAAHQIVVNFASMTFMVSLGIASATSVCVGQAAGAGDRAGVRRAGFTGIALAALAMSVAASLMLFVPGAIIAMYTHDAAVTDIAMGLIFAAALFQVSDGVQVCTVSALRGLKDTLYPLVLSVIAYWCLGLPVAWYFGFTRAFGPQGLWVGLIAGLSFAALMLIARFQGLSRRIKLGEAKRALKSAPADGVRDFEASG